LRAQSFQLRRLPGIGFPQAGAGNLAMIGGLIGVTLHYLRFGPKKVDGHEP
jgi:hypothetical protein